VKKRAPSVGIQGGRGRPFKERGKQEDGTSWGKNSSSIREKRKA